MVRSPLLNLSSGAARCYRTRSIEMGQAQASRLKLMPQGHSTRHHRFAQVIRMGKIQYAITQNHHQCLVLANKGTGQGLITGLNNDPLSTPLPELTLRRPELFATAADDQCGILLTALFLLP